MIGFADCVQVVCSHGPKSHSQCAQEPVWPQPIFRLNVVSRIPKNAHLDSTPSNLPFLDVKVEYS